MDGLENISPVLIESKKGIVLFSGHSIKRFMMRWYIRHHSQITADEAVAKMTPIIEGSREEYLDKQIRFRRLISNQGREARYFYINGWRFVIQKSEITNLLRVMLVITVELDKYGFQRRLPNRSSKPIPRRFRQKPRKRRKYSKQKRLEL